jgi:hypothetical protein
MLFLKIIIQINDEKIERFQALRPSSGLKLPVLFI